MNSYLKSWIRIGSISGLLGLCFYFLAVFHLIPYEISRLIAFFIGPLLVIAFLGLYNLIKVRVANNRALADLMKNQFGKISSITSTKTTIVLETLKETSDIKII